MPRTPEITNAIHRGWPFVALRGVLAVGVAAVVLTRPSIPAAARNTGRSR